MAPPPSTAVWSRTPRLLLGGVLSSRARLLFAEARVNWGFMPFSSLIRVFEGRAEWKALAISASGGTLSISGARAPAPVASICVLASAELVSLSQSQFETMSNGS